MGIRTILVDDEVLARERLRLLLQDQKDIEIIEEASNGVEALAKIRTHQPDLVFLDIEMPGFNGFKVVQSLARERRPKIIFTTAYNQYAIEAFEAGAIDYVLKPVKKDRLLESIQRARTTMPTALHDLTLARHVQERLLPERDLKLGAIEMAGACLAAREVGGDYYDFIILSPTRVGICIADISGKGFSAALMMANLQATLKILAKEINEPAALVTEINKLFYENSIPEMYATLLYGVYERDRNLFTFCNAGHPPPLLSRGSAIQRLDCGGTVVGLFADAQYEQASIVLRAGDVMVAYSDGLIELTNQTGQEFSEARVINLLQDNLKASAVELKNLLLERARCFADTAQDDVTVMVLKVVP